MAAVGVGMRTPLTSATIARSVVAVAVAALVVGAFAIIALHSTTIVLGPSGAVLLASDLIPFVTVIVTTGFLLTAPSFTGFTAYLSIALVVYVLGAIGISDRAAALMPTAGPLWNAFVILSVFGFLPIAYLFPSGRFAPRWTRWLLLGCGGAAVLSLAFPWDPFPPVPLALLSGLGISLVLSAIAVQIWRYRSVSTSLERQQTKWMLLALGLQFAYFLVVMGLPPNTLTSIDNEALAGAVHVLHALVTTGMVVAVGFAMLRYRLFDVDLVIGRTLVYGSLSVFILACYAVVVGALGLLWPAGTPLALPILATALAALGTEPLRRTLQRRVNRRLYGQRDEPVTVLTRLGDEFAATADLDGTLARLVETIGGSLRLPRVRVVIEDGPIARTAVAGDPSAERDEAVVPLRFQAREIGRLYVTPRPGERLTSRDQDLLSRIAPQAAVAVHSALVTEALRRSRDAIVDAREKERRRLHRDLHDGLGPMLSSLHQRIDLADRAIDDDPSRAHRLLDGARSGLMSTLTEVREIVDALRPALLDELGLVAAVTDAWKQESRVSITEQQGLPALPAAIEVAAYRIALEATGNAVRHADAAHIDVQLRVEQGMLEVTVADDGRGGVTAARVGGGLRTMRDRATELGGELVIAEARPGPGTIVAARLPLEGDRP